MIVASNGVAIIVPQSVPDPTIRGKYSIFKEGKALVSTTWVLYDNPSGNSDYPWKSVVCLYSDENRYDLVEQLTGTFNSLGDALTHTSNVVRARQLVHADIEINSAAQPPLQEAWTVEEILRREA